MKIAYNSDNYTTLLLQMPTSRYTHSHNHFMALWMLSWTTRVSWYQK